MRIPKYWAHGQASGVDRKGKKVSFTCWHWSERSFEEAKSLADARAAGLLNRVTMGDVDSFERYPYGVRPMREEIVQTLSGRKGEEIAIVTRNGYGALVLNSARAMFMDIDLIDEWEEMEKRKAQQPGFFARLFGTKKPPQDPVLSLEEKTIVGVRDWARHRLGLALRIYRTRAGLRLLITNKTYDPTDPAVERMMTELNCDPLYVRLCKQQECFRARLTPKPWRCGCPAPALKYPFESPRLEKYFREWVEDYRLACEGWEVCRLVESIGTEVSPEVAPILELHDKYCCTGDGRDLA